MYRCLRACSVVLIFLASSNLFAAGGTHIIATKGQPVAVSAWPEGVGELVNDLTRTTGWHSTFCQWPNDVNHYALEIATTDDLNRLIEKLAAVKEIRKIRLSHLKEPASLGWVTNLPEGNNIPAIFSFGDQARIDEWFKQVRKPFGKMEFTAAPIAVPQTLTIFVRSKTVNPEQLKIPERIGVTSGYVPTLFHRSNTKDEKKKEEEAARNPVPSEKLDPAEQAAVDKLEAFLRQQKPLTSFFDDFHLLKKECDDQLDALYKRFEKDFDAAQNSDERERLAKKLRGESDAIFSPAVRKAFERVAQKCGMRVSTSFNLVLIRSPQIGEAIEETHKFF